MTLKVLWLCLQSVAISLDEYPGIGLISPDVPVYSGSESVGSADPETILSEVHDAPGTSPWSASKPVVEITVPEDTCCTTEIIEQWEYDGNISI